MPINDCRTEGGKFIRDIVGERRKKISKEQKIGKISSKSEEDGFIGYF